MVNEFRQKLEMDQSQKNVKCSLKDVEMNLIIEEDPNEKLLMPSEIKKMTQP